MTKSKLFTVRIITLLSAAVIAGCASSGGGQTSGTATAPDTSSDAGQNIVSITGTKFLPPVIVIDPGETVTWVNDDAADHDVLGTSFQSGILKAGDSFQQAFEQTGTYEYVSSTHPGMTGKVTVNSPPIEELQKVEIKEYQGKNLSSVAELKPESIYGTAHVDVEKYKLQIDGLVETPIELTYDEVLLNTKYKKVVTLNCIEGWSADILWEGVLLEDLFAPAKVRAEANTVIFYAADGYTTSLPLQVILDRDLMLAYKMNDLILTPDAGYPLRLVAEDKLGYKWIKWITRIELSDDSDYEGYWEREGYSNEADVNP